MWMMRNHATNGISVWIRRGLATLLALCLVMGSVGALADAILKQGSQGEAVRRLQERLIELCYLAQGDAEDGVYDEITEAAILLFQERNHLMETGMADEVTQSVLYSDAAVSNEYVPSEEEWLFGEPCEEAMDGFFLTSAMYAFMPASGVAWNTEEYTFFHENGFQSVSVSPLSTFAADVDTSAYAQLRSKILRGEAVPPDSVRVEEMLNYFQYEYPTPEGDDFFGVYLGYGPCPWNQETRLVQIGLQARNVEREDTQPHHLVFLIDTSGSMEGSDRLDLVKRAFLLLLDQLQDTDTISIVAYASQDRVVLEGVPASEKTRIMEAISELEARGATNGTAGLLRAYEVAERHMIPGGVNRILLATDGDLNVGVTSEGDLARLVEEKKQSGVELTCLGFGYGNYKDNKLEALADYGNGNCWYIDSILEARKALVTEGGGTFRTVAWDTKLQVEFNPSYIRGYRLIGYEDRELRAEQFADDTVDGGEVGSGHRVTALYEVVPVDSAYDFGEVTTSYSGPASGSLNGELLKLQIRAKKQSDGESQLSTYVLKDTEEMDQLDDNMKLAAAVAELAMILRDSPYRGSADYGEVLDLLRKCATVTGDVYKEELVYLVGLLQRREQAE